MVKKLFGIWHHNKVLCPKCLVSPGSIKDYGTDGQGYWFQALCPHCRAVIKWYRDFNFSDTVVSMAEGEQLSLVVETKRRKGQAGKAVLVLDDK